MSRNPAVAALTSLRTTVVLFCLLAVLLFLNVALPQERVVGEERFAEIIGSNPLAAFFLETLGLGRLSVSVVFLLFLALFFVHLTAVLVKRTGVTIRRTRLRAPTIETLEGWSAGDRALNDRAPDEIDRRQVLMVLKGFGYRTVPVGHTAVWSVKHRTAPLGFLLFHISFFLICLGGAAIYSTRFVGTARVVEGRAFGGFTTIIREAPLAEPPELAFSVHQIEMRLENGQPVHLAADLRFRGSQGGEAATTRINHPARWGSASIMVNSAGLAPLIWLQDLQGFTLDRMSVAAATLTGTPTAVPFAEGRYIVRMRPLIDRSTFPARSELAATAFEFLVQQGDRTVFEGALLPGQEAFFDETVLVLEEIGYWAGLYIVSERGGGLLVAGFTLGILGLVWRLMLYRREVAVVWQGAEFSVTGRAEYFSNRFRDELETISTYLKREQPG